MFVPSQKLWFLAVATVGLLFSSSPVCPQTDETLQVLILNSYDESTAPYFPIRNVLMVELQKEQPSPIAFRQFDLRERNGNESARDELKWQLLQSEFASAPPDLVVAVGPPACNFWLSYRAPDFSNVPFIGVGAEIALSSMDFRPGDAAVMTPFSFSDTIEDILGLLPETTQIVMVFGSSSHEQALAVGARKQLESTHDRIKFEYTNDMKLKELQNKLARLQPGTVVFFGIFDSDVDGVLLNQHAGLALVRKSSSVPVFGAFDDQLGLGIIGGRLIGLEQIGIETAVTAQEMLQSFPSDIVWKTVDMEAPAYDWRELQAWEIDPDRLPPGSVIRFKLQTLWETHAKEILLNALVIAVLLLLITALWLQNRRRRRAELASSRLGRRLISAQEDERRYLARELHDDLSQRLARVAIDASFVASSQGSDAANEVLQNLQPELVSISKDVHDMSYRLHPALIDDLGLVAALQTECERLRRYTDAAIIEQFDEIDAQIPSDVALCIYRIAQEAINNSVKYSSADTIELALGYEKDLLALTVRDNGSGFDITHQTEQSGLGLASMRERAQLAGGLWTIRSQPGEGTMVSARIPLQGSVK